MTASNGNISSNIVADAFKHLNARHNLNDSIRAGSFHRISTEDKVFQLITGGETYHFIRPDDGTASPWLDVVIVGIHPATSKMYYEGTYRKGASGPPTCASLMGISPDPGVPIPQSKYCNGCRRDQFGPNKTGKQCQDHKRVAVVILPTMKTRPALAKALNEPVFFKVTPASLTAWKAYMDDLQDRGIPFPSVITRISFEPDKQHQFKFDLLRGLKNADAQVILPLLVDSGKPEAAATKMILGSVQEYKQINPPAPEPPEETGLQEAFGGGQAQTIEQESTSVVPMEKRGRGRPVGSRTRKSPEPEESQQQEAIPAEELAQETQEENESTFQESNDPSLNDMFTDIMKGRTNRVDKN